LSDLSGGIYKNIIGLIQGLKAYISRVHDKEYVIKKEKKNGELRYILVQYNAVDKPVEEPIKEQ